MFKCYVSRGTKLIPGPNIKVKKLIVISSDQDQHKEEKNAHC